MLQLVSTVIDWLWQVLRAERYSYHLRHTSEKISEIAITKTISSEKTKIDNKCEFC